jgi:hypothetical protein
VRQVPSVFRAVSGVSLLHPDNTNVTRTSIPKIRACYFSLRTSRGTWVCPCALSPDNIFPVSIDGGKQVRGTPGSGKSILLELLKNHVPKDSLVHRIGSWRSKDYSRSYYFIAAALAHELA